MPMLHPLAQVPAWQVIPAPQVLPSATVGCWQVPAPSQASVVQGLPSSGQDEPAALLVQEVALLAGSHFWQGLAGLAAWAAWLVPPMRQPPQPALPLQLGSAQSVLPSQSSSTPSPQAVSEAAQLSQAPCSQRLPSGQVASTQRASTHLPAQQTSPVAQDLPGQPGS
ncbi:MAG: hypothetical protein QM765_08975 [Myxococcales bacterium]